MRSDQGTGGQDSQAVTGSIDFGTGTRPFFPHAGEMLVGLLDLSTTVILAETMGHFLEASELFFKTPPNAKDAIVQLYLALNNYQKVPNEHLEIFKAGLKVGTVKKDVEAKLFDYIQTLFGQLPGRHQKILEDLTLKKQVLYVLKLINLYFDLGGEGATELSLCHFYKARVHELLQNYQAVYEEIKKIDMAQLVDPEKVFCTDLFERTCKLLNRQAEFKEWRAKIRIKIENCLTEQQIQLAWKIAADLTREELKQFQATKKMQSTRPRPAKPVAPAPKKIMADKNKLAEKKLFEEKLALVTNSYDELKSTLVKAETIKKKLTKSSKNVGQSLKKIKKLQEEIGQIKNLMQAADKHFVRVEEHHNKLLALQPGEEIEKKSLKVLTQAKELDQHKATIATETNDILGKLQRTLDQMTQELEAEKLALQQTLSSAESDLQENNEATKELNALFQQAQAIVVRPRYWQRAQSDFNRLQEQAEQKIAAELERATGALEKMTAARAIQQKITAMEGQAEAAPDVSALAHITTIEAIVKNDQQRMADCRAAWHAESAKLSLSVQAENKKITQLLIQSRELMAKPLPPKPSSPLDMPLATAPTFPSLSLEKLKILRLHKADFDLLYSLQDDLEAEIILYGSAATAIAFAMSPESEGPGFLELIKALPFSHIDLMASVADLEKARSLFRTKHQFAEKYKEPLKIDNKEVGVKFYNLEKKREGGRKLYFTLINSGKIILQGRETCIYEDRPSPLPLLSARIHLLKKPPFSPQQLARFTIASLDDGHYIGLEKKHGLMLQFKQRSHLLVAKFSTAQTKRYAMMEGAHERMQSFIVEDKTVVLSADERKYFMTYDEVRESALQEMQTAFQQSDAAFYSRYLEIIGLLRKFKQFDHPKIVPYVQAFFTCLVAHFQPNLIHSAAAIATSIMDFLKDYYHKNNIKFLSNKILRQQFNFITHCNLFQEHNVEKIRACENHMDEIVTRNARRIPP